MESAIKQLNYSSLPSVNNDDDAGVLYECLMNHISSIFVYIYILYIIIPVKVFAPTAKTLEMFCPLRDRIKKSYILYICIYLYLIYYYYSG